MKMAESYCALLRASCRHSLKNLSILETAAAVVGAPASKRQGVGRWLAVRPACKNNGVFAGGRGCGTRRRAQRGGRAPPVDAIALGCVVCVRVCVCISCSACWA